MLLIAMQLIQGIIGLCDVTLAALKRPANMLALAINCAY